MELADLVKILEGNIGLIDSVNVKDIALYETRVYVRPKHVRNMLVKFLTGKISAEDLTRWAKFITLRTEYGSEYYLDEGNEDYLEDMFYVIQRLSTPEIDGEVNEFSVKRYLRELDKYKDEF